MIGSSLPPRGLFLGTRVFFTRDLSPHLKETLLQILALCASAGEHATPPVSIRTLAQLTAKPDRTLREHIALLREQGLLQLNATGQPYQFTLHLADWLFDDRLPPQEACANLASADSANDVDPNPAPIRARLSPNPLKEEEEEFNLINDLNFLPLPPDNNHLNGTQPKTPANHGRARKPERARETGRAKLPRHATQRAPDNLPADLRQRLLSAGVFPALLHEIATRAEQDAYSPEDLLALLDWCAADQPESHAALFIGRLRAGARAPAAYTQPVCPRCGQRGGHAADCPRRYLMDTQ